MRDRSYYRGFGADCGTAKRGPRSPRIDYSAPNGIDFEAIRNAYPGGASTDLVVVGRLLPHKRVTMLLDAVALLHGDGIPVTAASSVTGRSGRSCMTMPGRSGWVMHRLLSRRSRAEGPLCVSEGGKSSCLPVGSRGVRYRRP